MLAAPALVAEQMQWSSKLDTVVEDVHSVHVGGLVFSAKRIDSLSQELRNLVLDTGRVTANALTKRIRSEDDDAGGELVGRRARKMGRYR
ncbi:MAG TPA: hypothetical protein VM580_18920 [Labilithrix sp.]|nr:hypothetical protein [Labilithrix sp.]